MQLELREVNKSFGDHIALHPTSLAFEECKTTVLIGPSGCGKSTILRLLMGLLEPSTGSVVVGDSRSKIGYVIQDGGLFPHLTARDNVALAARYFGVSKGEIEQRIRDLSSLVHLPAELLDRFPLELSGGQRQRVGLMRALMLKPQALLLDEPLGALDPMVRSTLQTDLKDIFAALGQTVVFVTHDMGEAGYLGDRIVLLKDGRVVQSGSLEDFQQRPAEPFVTEFLNAQRSLVSL